jgi:hypothetical protein
MTCPANPAEVMVIRKLTDEITTLSVPFKRFGKFQIGGRATLIRLPSGSVAVFSPVSLTDDVRKTVKEMGELKYIVAPDLEHHMFIHPWYQAYPNARVLAPKGLAAKRQKQNNPEVPIAVEFDAPIPNSVSVDPEFDAAFDSTVVAAHPNKELVFNHRASGTLVEADLLFNLPATEQNSRMPGGLYGAEAGGGNAWTKVFSSVMHTQGEALWPKRFIWYLLSRRDRPGFSKCVNDISQWKFDRIVPAHGDVVETGGKALFEKMFSWHLDSVRKGGKL